MGRFPGTYTVIREVYGPPELRNLRGKERRTSRQEPDSYSDTDTGTVHRRGWTRRPNWKDHMSNRSLRGCRFVGTDQGLERKTDPRISLVDRLPLSKDSEFYLVYCRRKGRGCPGLVVDDDTLDRAFEGATGSHGPSVKFIRVVPRITVSIPTP